MNAETIDADTTIRIFLLKNAGKILSDGLIEYEIQQYIPYSYRFTVRSKIEESINLFSNPMSLEFEIILYNDEILVTTKYKHDSDKSGFTSRHIAIPLIYTKELMDFENIRGDVESEGTKDVIVKFFKLIKSEIVQGGTHGTKDI